MFGYSKISYGDYIRYIKMSSVVLVLVMNVSGANCCIELSVRLPCENTMGATSRIYMSHLLNPLYELSSQQLLGDVNLLIVSILYMSL